MSRNGNVRREDKSKTDEVPNLEKGDVVALTAAVIRRRDYANMTPRLLYEIGHPNEFLVTDVFETPDDGLCVQLFPCCRRFEDRENGKVRCTGHPAILFQKIKKERQAKKGDRSTAIHIPFLEQALAALYYDEDEASPTVRASILGKEVSLSGPIAKMVKQFAEENNIL
jgi:hypothetical protein